MRALRRSGARSLAQRGTSSGRRGRYASHAPESTRRGVVSGRCGSRRAALRAAIETLHQNLFESEWREADTGRKRKYYRLSKEGRKALKEEKEHWLSVHTTLAKLWKPSPSSI